MAWVVAAFLLLLTSSFSLGKHRARSLAVSSHCAPTKLAAQPNYHGYYVALWCGIPALIIVALWSVFEPVVLKSLVLNSVGGLTDGLSAAQLNVLLEEVQNVALGAFGISASSPSVLAAAENYKAFGGISRLALGVVFLSTAVAGVAYGRAQLSVGFKARHAVEKCFRAFMFICSTVAILTTVGIVCSLIFESIRFFQLVSMSEFLFGTKWSPQMAIRADQVASSGAFGAIPLFSGTLLISAIAMLVAAPVGLFSAIFLVEYSSPRVRSMVKPLLEILAGIPTVVYGFFAALTVAPWVRDVGQSIGLSVSSESALAAGVVMGVMIIPFVSSLSDDVINAVPQTLRDGSFALGATKSETIRQVVLPAALPGIVGAMLLAVSRAIGETMIVVMAAGLTANLTANPLSNVTTVTVQIVTILVGDQEFDSAKTLSAFALGLVLFCITLVLNIFALQIVKKYREKYD